MDIPLALGIFITSYLLIVIEKFNKAFVACAGGIVMVMAGIVDIDDMFIKHIDWETIMLLFSMMVIVSITSHTGIFEYIAVLLAQKVHGQPLPLLAVISCFTAFGSAFLDNVTTVLLLVPIVLTLTDMLEIASIPYLTAIILFSNIGGTATLIGDPPNIMIGQEVDHLEFNDFLVHLTPVVVVIYCLVLMVLTLYYRRSLHVSGQNRRKLQLIKPSSYLEKGPVLVKSIAILCLTIIGFVLHPFFHVELVTVGLAGALLLVLLTYKQQGPEKMFRSVEWMTLIFFAGLFMLVGGLKESGVIEDISRGILHYTDGDLPTTALFILWGSGLFSGFVDNIPFVAAMIPVIQEFHDYGLADADPLWWALSLGSCLGGNSTLIGASANVIVAGMAAKHGQPLGFLQFLKIGFPIVLLSLAISSLYLYFRYLIDFQ
ncbi:MAG TPA: ArsB/NhaD family transporter [Bacillales bacterium]|nr:ArsB/NhaD family transporter [Bacillales bacterium]